MSRDYAFLGLVFSLCIHGILVLLMLQGTEPPSEAPVAIEVDIRDSEDEKTKWIVDPQTQKTEDLAEKLKKEADFVSQLNQRVQEQMRARRGPKTQNAAPRATVKPPPKFTYDSSEGDYRPTDPMLRKEAIGFSQFAETVPGIQEGFFNALNTDQLTYFSFYSRVNSQIANRWVAIVRHYLLGLSAAEIKALAQSDKKTVVEVLLDREGNYFSSLIHSSSGVQALDEATFKAFHAAAPFLNPPAGLVKEEDGLIHLYYQFVVVFKPSPMAGTSDF